MSSVLVQRVSPDAAPYHQRDVPNGSVELRMRLGEVPELTGPLTAPRAQVLAPGTTMIGVRFHPRVATPVLGMPASELVDLSVRADELWGRSAAALADVVAGAPSPEAALRLLEEHLARRLAAAPPPDPLVREATRRLMPWRAADVGEVTSALNVSERHLRRRFASEVGLAPKALHRILRFQGFLALAQQALAQGRSPAREGLAAMAAEAGYADQPHLTHECLRLTGLTPRAFLTAVEDHCGSGHDHSASFQPLLRARAA